jgi:tetratricopeptide (TPR) repeat protein
VATAREKGDWAIATPILEELWANHDGNERVAVELAENLIYEEQWDRAVELLTPFAETEPPHVRALHLMGRCRMHQGDYDGAIRLLERAKIINPHNVERLIDLGNSFLRNDQIDQAMSHFSDALALDEDNKDATVGKGQCHLMSGEINEALTLLKAVSGPRELASIFNTAAILAMRQDRHEQGMQLYQSALKAIGHDDKVTARLMYNMGLGYKRWQKPEKAQLCFEKAVELDPTFVKALQKQTGSGASPSGGGREANEDVASIDEETIGGRRRSSTPLPLGGDAGFDEDLEIAPDDD